MTPDEIDSARRKILQNARQLLREAKLLAQHRHFARAYTLSHLACEELARLPMLVSAGLRIAAHRSVDWRRLNKRLRDHRLKLRMLESMETPPAGDPLARWQQIERAARVFNGIKNRSLYADKWRGRFRKPSEIVRDLDARVMIRMAEFRLRTFARTERRGGSLKRFVDWPELPAMLERIERKADGFGGGA